MERQRSSVLPVAASVVAALLVCAAFRFVGECEPRSDRDGALADALGRIERRLADVEHQVRLAAGGRVEPAEVTRVAEERGIGLDDAWNEYFDGIVSRLDRIEQRLDGGETPAPPEVELGRLAALQQFATATTLQPGTYSVEGTGFDGWSGVVLADGARVVKSADNVSLSFERAINRLLTVKRLGSLQFPDRRSYRLRQQAKGSYRVEPSGEITLPLVPPAEDGDADPNENAAPDEPDSGDQ